MMARSHLTTGLAAGSWVAGAGHGLGVPLPAAVLGGILVGYSALLPDLDHPGSTVTHSLGPATRLVSWLLCLFVEHRGWTHTRSAAAVFGLPVALLALLVPAPLGGPVMAVWWWACVFVGCCVHLWGDARTMSGIPWPGRDRGYYTAVRDGRLRIGRVFSTGSEVEASRLAWLYFPVSVMSWVGVALLVL